MNPKFTTISIRKDTAAIITKIEELTKLKRAEIISTALNEMYEKAKRNHELIKKLDEQQQ